MSELEQLRRGRQMLTEGRSDEDVERSTGISLLQIIGLRAAAAVAPGKRRRMTGTFPYKAERYPAAPLASDAGSAYIRAIVSHNQGAAD